MVQVVLFFVCASRQFFGYGLSCCSSRPYCCSCLLLITYLLCLAGELLLCSMALDGAGLFSFPLLSLDAHHFRTNGVAGW